MSGPDHDLGAYPWRDADPTCAHQYLLPELEQVLTDLGSAQVRRTLDLGCGNGAVTAWLAQRWGREAEIIGVDPSREGIVNATRAHPEISFHRMSGYDPLRRELGAFTLVVCLEVIEHVYDPPGFAARMLEVLEPGGFAIVSTPYHGWVKNVATAVLGRFDRHVEALRVHGHIKFWSRHTFTRLLHEAGFEVRSFHYAGRIRPLAKSMIAVARRPSGESPRSAAPQPLAGEA